MQLNLQALPNDLSLSHQLIVDLVGSLLDYQKRIEQLKQELERLRRYQFGRRSERLLGDAVLFEFAGLLQAVLEKADEAEAKEKPEGETEETAALKKPRGESKKGHGRGSLPEHLPKQRIEHTLSPQECQCSQCGHPLEPIGEEVSRQLDYQPASFYITEHVRIKYACQGCESTVVTSERPSAPIEKGLPGPGLLAQVLVSKYADHLPLNRLEGIFARHGVEISRQTMCDWVKYSTHLLSPLYEAMKGDTLDSGVLGTDDTPVPVQEAGRGQTKEGRIWVYVGDADHAQTVYDYTENRSREGPQKFLEGFQGVLQADAYAGYDGIFVSGKVQEAGCWAHARRKFFDAKSTEEVLALQALAYIRTVYQVEQEGKALDPPARQKLRQEKSRPILEGFHRWLLQRSAEVLPKSPMGQAIGYALGQWTALNRYLDNGAIPIDNNASERALRGVVIGRKNYLFYGSDQGGHRAAIIYTMVATCKRHGVDLFAYLRDILERLPSHSIQNLHELFPQNWKAA